MMPASLTNFMEFRLLADQNVVAVTPQAKVVFLAENKDFEQILAAEKPAVVIAFSELATKRSNRDILVCDWPGEYEKSEVSVIGPSTGAFVVSLEGKTWLAMRDQDMGTLDHDADQLNTVEGLIVWLTSPDCKAAVQKCIDHLEPAHLIYVAGNQIYGADLLPPAPVPAAELSLKAGDWSSVTEQTIPHTLQ